MWHQLSLVSTTLHDSLALRIQKQEALGVLWARPVGRRNRQSASAGYFPSVDPVLEASNKRQSLKYIPCSAAAPVCLPGLTPRVAARAQRAAADGPLRPVSVHPHYTSPADDARRSMLFLSLPSSPRFMFNTIGQIRSI